MAIVSFAGVTAEVARRISGEFRRTRRRVLVAIDGPDCSGKTTLCANLVMTLKTSYSVLPVHFDDYLNPKAQRLRRGVFSAHGFRRDYFDATALRLAVLAPLRKRPADDPPQIVIVEGLFLMTRSLKPYFNLCIRLEIADELLMCRALARDVDRLGPLEWIQKHYRRQCIPAQQLYRHEVHPGEMADMRITVLSDDKYELAR